jgi:hypothetical protein
MGTGIGRIAMLRRGAAAVLAIVAVGVVVALKQGGGGDETAGVGGTPADVVSTIDRFQTALAGRDYQTICDRLYSSHAREAAGGDNCPSVLAQSAANLRDPRVTITGLAVNGDAAVVSVRASTASQRAAPDTISLVREGGHFRIDSAGLESKRARRGG